MGGRDKGGSAFAFSACFTRVIFPSSLFESFEVIHSSTAIDQVHDHDHDKPLCPEFQILDRFSFQRFLGLSVGDGAPDKNTIWDFKQRLGWQGMKSLFELFGGLLAEKGLVGKGGKIVDASFVDVPRRRVGAES